MYRGLLLVLAFFLLFVGCSTATQGTHSSRVGTGKRFVAQSSEFDKRAMRAFSAEKMGDTLGARDEFLAIYKDFNITSSLESAYTLTLMNDFDKKDEINELAKAHTSESPQLARLSAVYYLQNAQLSKAQRLIEATIKKDKDFRNEEILGDILSQKREFKAAYKAYQKSKELLEDTPNELISLKIAQSAELAEIKGGAKRELESFVDISGCTVRICLALAKIYAQENDEERLRSLYIKLYEATNDRNFLRALAEGLIYEKNYSKALEVVLKYDLGDDMALFLYEKTGKLAEARVLAMKIYNENKEKKYLLLAAVMEFEQGLRAKKVNKKLLGSVGEKFEEGIDENADALYLNYYGYLLIDYEIDISKGMTLVKRALQRDPNNLYYLDSLSWGYYKQGKCDEAWDVMLKTMHDTEFSDSEESKSHINAIRRCLSGAKR